MSQGVQINKPTVLNMDKAKASLQPNEMFYALNNDILNSGANGKATPLPSNYLGCDIEMPEGDNYVIGSHYANLTNETYVVVGNSLNNHFIYRITGNDGFCQIVNQSPCLTSVLGLVEDGVFAPKYSLEPWRMFLRVEKLCANRHGKQLIFTNGLGNIACIDVEASIATDSFSTPFFDMCAVGCETVEMCVPDPCGCIAAEFIPLEESERGLTNKNIGVGLKFIYQHVYYDLRASEWSARSSLYYQDGKACFSNTEGFPRCVQLTIPLGNPLVDKIKIGYSTDNGANWLLADTVEKYASYAYTSSDEYWYERSINSELDLTEDECFFKYKFCNDKQCETIDPTDVSRVFNPMARKPQGFIQIKELLGYYNFISGTCPIDRAEIDKFSVGIECSGTDQCYPEYVSVTVRAVIHNLYYEKNNPIYRVGGELNGVDDTSDTAYFGGAKLEGLEDTYHSHFVAKKRNFTVNIKGTEYYAEMKQWKADDGFVNRIETGVLSGINNEDNVNTIGDASNYWYQEAVLRVKKGAKGFLTLQSHESESNNSTTSTYVKGILDDIADYSKNGDVTSLPYTEFLNEIEFDTTSGDVEITQAFIVEDNFKYADFVNHSSALFYGYLKLEDGRPIEYAELWSNDTRWSVTDRNGFFYKSFDDLDGIMPLEVRVEQDCDAGFDSIKSVTLTGGYGGAVRTDIVLMDSETEDYRDVYLANVEVLVVDCDGNPVGGVQIAMSGSLSRATGADGIAHFEVRNNSSRDREITAIVMDRGCLLIDCDDVCNAPLPSDTEDLPACLNTTPTITFTAFEVNPTETLFNKGLKKGGRYGYGIVAKSSCGRISPAYELKNGFIDVPKLQENEIRDFCTFTYNANSINLPDWVDCLEIVRTENISPFELQWIVDKIERTNDGLIRLTIQSLNDYNAKYLFKTNTIYKYLEGDRVEFIENGDGSIFTIDDNGLLNYATLSPFNDSDNTEADYFNQLLIRDDNRLDALTEGAIIEIQRQKECTTEPAYRAICVSLRVEDGQVVNQTGTFTTFDTYTVTRNIGDFYQKTFEHHSPSDFWGNRLSDVGRAYFVNKYENEKRFGRSVILTYADQINRFDSTLMKTFDAPEQGDITAMYIVDGKIIIAIGENDNALAQVSDSLVRIGSDGIARAAQPDQIISDTQPKISGQFGCRYEDIGSVIFGDGYIKFYDVKRGADVIHNFNSAQDVSEVVTPQGVVGRVKSYLKRKFADMQLANSQAGTNYYNHFRFAAGVDKHTNAVNTTIKKLTQGGINNNQAPTANTNETLMYHPAMNEYLGLASFTPEFYGTVNLMDEKGAAFLAFLNGKPYIHPIIHSSYLEFFGQTVDWVIGVAINEQATKVKRALSLEVQDAASLWYVSKVSTDNPNFDSEIPVVKAKRNEDKVNMAFLNDKNSIGGLFNGNNPRGYFIGVLLVRDNSDNLKYGTLDAEKRRKYSELNLILSKFTYSESSGYPQLNR